MSTDQSMMSQRYPIDSSADTLRHQAGPRWTRVSFGDVTADLLGPDAVLDVVLEHLDEQQPGLLAIAALDRDYLRRFGGRRRAARQETAALEAASRAHDVRWLSLVTSNRLARRAQREASQNFAAVPMPELTRRLLDEAQRRGLRVGFLCDSRRRRDATEFAVARGWPRLIDPQVWAVTGYVLDDDELAGQLSESIKKSRVDLVFTQAQTPRQQRWIAELGAASGAAVCVALGRHAAWCDAEDVLV